MKKLLAIMSAMLMVVSLLAGCGGAPASGSGAGTSSGGYELALVTDIAPSTTNPSTRVPGKAL